MRARLPQGSRKALARLSQGRRGALREPCGALREPCESLAGALRAQGSPCASLAGARLEPCARRASLAGALREPCASLAGAGRALREGCASLAGAGLALRPQGSSLARARLARRALFTAPRPSDHTPAVRSAVLPLMAASSKSSPYEASMLAGADKTAFETGVDCVLKAFIAPPQQRQGPARSKSELQGLIVGVFCWFLDGVVPKRGQQDAIVIKVCAHVVAELKKAQPPPAAAGGGGAGQTPTTATGGDSAAKPSTLFQWGDGRSAAKRSVESLLTFTPTCAAAPPSPSPRAHWPTCARLPTPITSPTPAPTPALARTPR